MVNVDPTQHSARYVRNTEGAPPVPPPGGYRGAARPRGPEQVLGLAQELPTSIAVPGAERTPNSRFGWIVLVVSALFAITLLVMLTARRPGVFFDMTALAGQAVVVGLIVAGLFSLPARRLSLIALAIALIVNVATMGAVSSSSSSMAGTYDGHKSADEKLWEQYPGLADTPADVLLSQPSLEEVRTDSEDVLAAVRDAVTARFGYTWVSAPAEDLSPVRNGYGGESMLQAYRSEVWTTEQPISSVADKIAVMEVINDVVTAAGMDGMTSLNDPRSGLDPAMLDKLYGSDQIDSQPIWEWYSYSSSGVSRMYADIYDLSLDTDGQFRQARQAAHDRTGEPTEGLQLSFYADALLSEDDVAEFTERLRKYP